MSPTGRCPFLVEIDRGVAVPLMHGAAGYTGPDPITERDMFVDVMTRGTPCGTRKPAAHMLHQHAGFLGDIDAKNNVLDGLRAELFPPGVLRPLLHRRDVGFQLIERQVFLVPAIVATTQRNGRVVNRPAHIDLAMQPLAAFAPIQFVLKRLALRHYVIPSRLAWARIITSSMAVILMADVSASARKSRLASLLSRRLVACGFSIPQVYTIFAVVSTLLARWANLLISPWLKPGTLRRTW